MKQWMTRTAVALGAAGLIAGSGLALWTPHSTKAQRAAIEEGTGIEIRQGRDVYANGNSIILVDSTRQGEEQEYFSVYWDKNANGVIDDGEEAVEYNGSDRIPMNARNSIYGAYGQVVEHPVRITVQGGTYYQVYGAYDSEVKAKEKGTPAVTVDVTGAEITGRLTGQYSSDLQGNLEVSLTDIQAVYARTVVSDGGTVAGDIHSTQKDCSFHEMTDVRAGQVTGDVEVTQTGGSVAGPRYGVTDSAQIDGSLELTIQGSQIPQLQTGEVTRTLLPVQSTLRLVDNRVQIAGDASLRLEAVQQQYSSLQYLVGTAKIEGETRLVAADCQFAAQIYGIDGGRSGSASVKFTGCTGTHLTGASDHTTEGKMDVSVRDTIMSGLLYASSGVTADSYYAQVDTVTGGAVCGGANIQTGKDARAELTDVELTKDGYGSVWGMNMGAVSGNLDVSLERIRLFGKSCYGIYGTASQGKASASLHDIYNAVSVNGVGSPNAQGELAVELDGVYGADSGCEVYGVNYTGEVTKNAEVTLQNLSKMRVVHAVNSSSKFRSDLKVRMAHIQKYEGNETVCYSLRNGVSVEGDVTVSMEDVCVDRLAGVGGFNGSAVDIGGGVDVTMKGCTANAVMYGAGTARLGRGLQVKLSEISTPSWYGVYLTDVQENVRIKLESSVLSSNAYGIYNSSSECRSVQADITADDCILGSSDETFTWQNNVYKAGNLRTHIRSYTPKYKTISILQNDSSKKGTDILRMDADTTSYYISGDYTFEKQPEYVSDTLPDITLKGNYIYKLADGATVSTSTLGFDTASRTELVIGGDAVWDTQRTELNRNTNLVLEGTLKTAGLDSISYNTIFMRGGEVEASCSPANAVELMSKVHSISYYPVTFTQNFPKEPQAIAELSANAACRSYPEEMYQQVSSGSGRRSCTIRDVTGYDGIAKYSITGEDEEELEAALSAGTGSDTLYYVMPAQGIRISYELKPKQIELEQKYTMPVAQLGREYTLEDPLYDLSSIYRKNDALYGEVVYSLGTEDGKNQELPEGLTLEQGRIIGTPEAMTEGMEVTFCIQGKNTSKAYITMKLVVADEGSQTQPVLPDIEVQDKTRRIYLHGQSVVLRSTEDGQTAIYDKQGEQLLASGDYSLYTVYGYYEEPVNADLMIRMESGCVREIYGAYTLQGDYQSTQSHTIAVNLSGEGKVTNLWGAYGSKLTGTDVQVTVDGGTVTGNLYGTQSGTVDNGQVRMYVNGGTVYRLYAAYGTQVNAPADQDYSLYTVVRGGTLQYLQDTREASTQGTAYLEVSQDAAVTNQSVYLSGCKAKIENIRGRTTIYGNYEYQGEESLSFMEKDGELNLGSGATLTIPEGESLTRNVVYRGAGVVDVYGSWNGTTLIGAGSSQLRIRTGAEVSMDSLTLKYLTIYNEGSLQADSYLTGSSGYIYMNEGARAELADLETPAGLFYPVDWSSDLEGTTIAAGSYIMSYTVDEQTKYYAKAGASCSLTATNVYGAAVLAAVNDDEPQQLTSGSDTAWTVYFTGKYEPMHVSVYYEAKKPITLASQEGSVTAEYNQVYSEGLPMFDSASLKICGDYRKSYGQDVTIEADEDSLPQGMAYHDGKLTGTTSNYRGETKDVVFTVTGRNGTQTQYVLHVTVLPHEHRWSEPESNVDEKGDTWSIRHCEICGDEDRELTATATPEPTQTPTLEPSGTPEVTPSAAPVQTPDAQPSETPEVTPSAAPVQTPDAQPSETPEVTPSAAPVQTPDAQPSAVPTQNPQQPGGQNPAPQPGDTTPGNTGVEQTVTTVGGVIYTVSSADAVTVTGVDSKKAKAKSLKIVDQVTINGRTYKVTAIGRNAFARAAKLKKLTVKATGLTSVHKTAFKKCPKKLVIRVPKKQKKAYTRLFRKAKRKVK